MSTVTLETAEGTIPALTLTAYVRIVGGGAAPSGTVSMSPTTGGSGLLLYTGTFTSAASTSYTWSAIGSDENAYGGGAFQTDANGNEITGAEVLTAIEDVPEAVDTELSASHGSGQWGGTTGTLTITPLQSTVAIPYTAARNIILDTGTAPPILYIITDANGDAINLAGHSLTWTAFTNDGDGNIVGQFQYSTALGSIAISGSSNNNVTVQIAATDIINTTPQGMSYVLRDITTPSAPLDYATGTLQLNQVTASVP